MPDVQDQFSHLVPGGANHAGQFLSIVRERCEEAQIGITLTPFQRSRREGGGAGLKGTLNHGQVLEVFAQPVGPNLQVGYQLNVEQLGGGFFGSHGTLGDINRFRQRRRNSAGNIRQVEGTVQAFQQIVLSPVIEELTQAVAASSDKPRRNGFLGV